MIMAGPRRLRGHGRGRAVLLRPGDIDHRRGAPVGSVVLQGAIAVALVLTVDLARLGALHRLHLSIFRGPHRGRSLYVLRIARPPMRTSARIGPGSGR